MQVEWSIYHAFPKKRAALIEHSNLQLKRKLMQLDQWGEASISSRGEA